MERQPLLSVLLKDLVNNKKVELACGYAGCGSADSWPLTLN